MNLFSVLQLLRQTQYHEILKCEKYTYTCINQYKLKKSYLMRISYEITYYENNI